MRVSCWWQPETTPFKRPVTYKENHALVHQHGKRLLLYNTPWLAMSQPFGLRMLLGVPQKRLAC